MKLSLNRGTTGGGLSQPDFFKLASSAGFPAADFDPGYAVQHSLSALKDLFAQHHLSPGGWGIPEWRKDDANWKEGLTKLPAIASAAAALNADSAATWLMPSSTLPFMEN